MSKAQFTLSFLPETLSVCRLEPDASFPDWVKPGTFVSITRTRDEMTVICPETLVPEGLPANHGWRALKLEGPFDLDLVGILVSVAAPLAQAGIGILPVGTFETDYILVREQQTASASKALRFVGFDVQGG